MKVRDRLPRGRYPVTLRTALRDIAARKHTKAHRATGSPGPDATPSAIREGEGTYTTTTNGLSSTSVTRVSTSRRDHSSMVSCRAVVRSLS